MFPTNPNLQEEGFHLICINLGSFFAISFTLIMDSEEDMLDAHDMESGEDDFYSGGTDDCNDSDDGEPDYGFVEEDADDSAMIASHRSQVGFFCSTWFGC